jgi:hypothetical protein
MSHAMARLTTPYLIRTNDYVDDGVSKYAFYQFILVGKKKEKTFVQRVACRICRSDVFNSGMSSSGRMLHNPSPIGNVYC